MTATLPTDFAPAAPTVERIARHLLDRKVPAWHYGLTDPDDVRRALSETYPGHVLQDVVADRDKALVDAMVEVQTILDYLVDATGLAALFMATSTAEYEDTQRGH